MKRKRKILMATADHLMIDRRIMQEAKSLVAHGHQVTLLAGFECAGRESYVIDGIRIERFVYDWQDSRFQALARMARLRPGTTVYMNAARAFRFVSNRLTTLNSFENFILDRMMEYEADVLHVHDYPMLAPATEFARLRHVPLVYDAHELYYAQVQLPEAVQRRYKRREHGLIGKANIAITVNPFIAQLMSERYGITPPTVIMNAAPLRPIVTDDLLRRRFGLSSDDRIVLYQGWISGHRGIERVVESASYFDPSVKLVIIGYGDYEANLKQLAKERGLESRVFFYGGVPSDELHALTCGADLGIIPYHGVDENNHYCSPNKLFEFTVAGLPFISNDLPFLRQISERFGNGRLADLTSPEAIAKAVNAVFSRGGPLESMRTAALSARETVNWDHEAKKLIDLYDSLPG